MMLIEPLGGLCNRMRTLDAALALAQQLQCDLHVAWPLRSNLNCRFDSLFEVPNTYASLVQFRDPKLFRSWRLRGYKKRFARFFDEAEMSLLVRQQFEFASVDRYRSVAIRTFERFYPTRSKFAEFVPIAAIQDKISAHVGNGSQMVGVHIRRTDNKRSIESSPTSKFIQCMRDELNANADTRFFVATDSPEEEAALQREFSGRIVTHAKASLARNDSRAIVDAVVDLYCLARCRKLIGSFYSSFTDTAAELYGTPLVIAKA
jgi:hypothetical protein